MCRRAWCALCSAPTPLLWPDMVGVPTVTTALGKIRPIARTMRETTERTPSLAHLPTNLRIL